MTTSLKDFEFKRFDMDMSYNFESDRQHSDICITSAARANLAGHTDLQIRLARQWAAGTLAQIALAAQVQIQSERRSHDCRGYGDDGMVYHLCNVSPDLLAPSNTDPSESATLVISCLTENVAAWQQRLTTWLGQIDG